MTMSADLRFIKNECSESVNGNMTLEDLNTTNDFNLINQCLFSIDIYLKYFPFPDDTQAELLNSMIVFYLNSGEPALSKNMAYRGLMYLLNNEDLHCRYKTLTKNITRFILSVPVKYHAQLASVFGIAIVSPIRNFDQAIAVMFDCLYERHCSDVLRLKSVFSSCVCLMLTHVQSENDYFQMFQFFLKCTSMIHDFRVDLWINGILFEALYHNNFVDSLMGQLIEETISNLRDASSFPYQMHAILAVLFSLLLRVNLLNKISADTLNSILSYLLEVSKPRDETGVFLQHFYACNLFVLNNYVFDWTLLNGEGKLFLKSLSNLIELFPKISHKRILVLMKKLTKMLSQPLDCARSFDVLFLWEKIFKILHKKILKNSKEDVKMMFTMKKEDLEQQEPEREDIRGVNDSSEVPDLVNTTPPYRGLYNPHAMCYANSVIQMLSKIKPFRNGFDRYCQEEGYCGDIHKTLKEVFNSLEAPLGESVVDASEFILYSRPDDFQDKRHEDADEYLRILITLLQAESTSKTSPPSPSYISEVFEGCKSLVSYCASCSAKTETEEETFDVLYLVPKQNEQGTQSIQDMINSPRTESTEAKLKCEGDHTGNYAKKVALTFQKLPPCIIFTVAIFNYDNGGEKIMNKFDVNETVVMKLEDGTERHYNLFGMVLHEGDQAFFGHYVWACKMDDQWTMFDDAKVETTSFEDISRADLSPYILVYTSADEERLPRRSPSRTN